MSIRIFIMIMIIMIIMINDHSDQELSVWLSLFWLLYFEYDLQTIIMNVLMIRMIVTTTMTILNIVLIVILCT